MGHGLYDVIRDAVDHCLSPLSTSDMN